MTRGSEISTSEPSSPTTTAGPILHALVRDQRLASITAEVETVIERSIEDAMGELRAYLGDIARRAAVQAYTSGLQDGFQQGCLAEAATHKEPTDA